MTDWCCPVCGGGFPDPPATPAPDAIRCPWCGTHAGSAAIEDLANARVVVAEQTLTASPEASHD